MFPANRHSTHGQADHQQHGADYFCLTLLAKLQMQHLCTSAPLHLCNKSPLCWVVRAAAVRTSSPSAQSSKHFAMQSSLWNPADYSGTLYKRGVLIAHAFWQAAQAAVVVRRSRHNVHTAMCTSRCCALCTKHPQGQAAVGGSGAAPRLMICVPCRWRLQAGVAQALFRA